jgi:hypothetical protein
VHDEFFGDATEIGTEKRPRLAVPGRSANVIESELLEFLMLASGPSEPPLLWLDGEGDELWTNAAEWAEWCGAPVNLGEALELVKNFDQQATEFSRRARIVAQECDGTMSDYFLRCDVEGIDPILKRKTP